MEPSEMKTFALSEAEYHDYENSMTGLCVSCGAERDCTEPDARNYPCEECDEDEVFGVPELLIMGLIDITEEEG